MADHRSHDDMGLTPDSDPPLPGAAPLPEAGQMPGPVPGQAPFPSGTPLPWPHDWWRCLRRGPVSGRYEGEMTGPAAGRYVLDLRVDIDPRHANSPVMDRVSGDLYDVYRFNLPGRPGFSWRVYRESWIVDAPDVTWSRCHVDITGTVRFWKGTHPPTTIRIRIPWSTLTPAGPAQVTFSQPAGTAQHYSCARRSDCFRDLKLEVDIVQSASAGLVLPAYDTHAHPTRPADLPQRVLTVQGAYREAGVCLTFRTEGNVIDDSAADFSSWSAAELHDAMETHFSQIAGTWPRWEMWGMLAGTFDNPGVGGIMFDAAAAYGGAGRAPERQGFAVFRNHQWFANLPAGTPASDAEAEALRQFLYTWVHEAGHAFNFLHSWNKNRPDALSWMNYDWRYDDRNGADSFWGNFRLRFDDDELIHLRHGDRSSVIMGGDPWASGGHIEAPPGAEYLEAPPGAMSVVEGVPPLEVLLRAKEYFEFLEPVFVEIRLRHARAELQLPLTVDTNLDPAYGGVIVYIRRPDGRIVEYDPIMCKLAEPALRDLQPPGSAIGTDRYSEAVFLSYGKYGFYFDEPGQYLVRALYQGAGDVLIPSNILRVRVGHPASKEADRVAQDFFSYEVGMNLYLGGSPSPFLRQGLDVLEDVATRYGESPVGATAATLVANSVADEFYRIEQRGPQRSLAKAQSGDPEKALERTDPVVGMYHRAQSGRLNLEYHRLVRSRARWYTAADEPARAKEEIATLRKDLAERGVNAPVLQEIQAYEDSLSTRKSRRRT